MLHVPFWEYKSGTLFKFWKCNKRYLNLVEEHRRLNGTLSFVRLIHLEGQFLYSLMEIFLCRNCRERTFNSLWGHSQRTYAEKGGWKLKAGADGRREVMWQRWNILSKYYMLIKSIWNITVISSNSIMPSYLATCEIHIKFNQFVIFRIF